jgi:hypothetical protein
LVAFVVRKEKDACVYSTGWNRFYLALPGWAGWLAGWLLGWLVGFAQVNSWS